MKFKFLVLLGFFIALCSASRAETAAVILKSTDVYVSRDKIYLSDIADFSGVARQDGEKLTALYIKKSAAPGFRIAVSKEYVANKVARYFKYLTVEGPAYVNVITSKGDVSRVEIEAKAREYVLSRMPWKAGEAEVEVKPGTQDIRVLDGEVLLKVKDDANLSFKGNLIVPVEIWVNGKFYKYEPVSMVVKVRASCAVAAENIQRNARLEPGSAVLEVKDITFIPRNVIVDLAKLANKAPKRAIMKGSILTEDMFESVPLFRRNAIVSVVAKVKSIMVETDGIAASDGREGDTVRVKLSSGKIIEGVVGPSGKVIIEKN